MAPKPNKKEEKNKFTDPEIRTHMTAILQKMKTREAAISGFVEDAPTFKLFKEWLIDCGNRDGKPRTDKVLQKALTHQGCDAIRKEAVDNQAFSRYVDQPKKATAQFANFLAGPMMVPVEDDRREFILESEWINIKASLSRAIDSSSSLSATTTCLEILGKACSNHKLDQWARETALLQKKAHLLIDDGSSYYRRMKMNLDEQMLAANNLLTETARKALQYLLMKASVKYIVDALADKAKANECPLTTVRNLLRSATLRPVCDMCPVLGLWRDELEPCETARDVYLWYCFKEGREPFHPSWEDEQRMLELIDYRLQSASGRAGEDEVCGSKKRAATTPATRGKETRKYAHHGMKDESDFLGFLPKELRMLSNNNNDTVTSGSMLGGGNGLDEEMIEEFQAMGLSMDMDADIAGDETRKELMEMRKKPETNEEEENPAQLRVNTPTAHRVTIAESALRRNHARIQTKLNELEQQEGPEVLPMINRLYDWLLKNPLPQPESNPQEDEQGSKDRNEAEAKSTTDGTSQGQTSSEARSEKRERLLPSADDEDAKTKDSEDKIDPGYPKVDIDGKFCPIRVAYGVDPKSTEELVPWVKTSKGTPTWDLYMALRDSFYVKLRDLVEEKDFAELLRDLHKLNKKYDPNKLTDPPVLSGKVLMEFVCSVRGKFADPIEVMRDGSLAEYGDVIGLKELMRTVNLFEHENTARSMFQTNEACQIHGVESLQQIVSDSNAKGLLADIGYDPNNPKKRFLEALEMFTDEIAIQLPIYIQNSTRKANKSDRLTAEFSKYTPYMRYLTNSGMTKTFTREESNKIGAEATLLQQASVVAADHINLIIQVEQAGAVVNPEYQQLFSSEDDSDAMLLSTAEQAKLRLQTDRNCFCLNRQESAIRMIDFTTILANLTSFRSALNCSQQANDPNSLWAQIRTKLETLQHVAWDYCLFPWAKNQVCYAINNDILRGVESSASLIKQIEGLPIWKLSNNRVFAERLNQLVVIAKDTFTRRCTELKAYTARSKSMTDWVSRAPAGTQKAVAERVEQKLAQEWKELNASIKSVKDMKLPENENADDWLQTHITCVTSMKTTGGHADANDMNDRSGGDADDDGGLDDIMNVRRNQKRKKKD
ncbi:unnamed protein product [Amoebophrya sp. A25]|nr:unnamed protein product [Amoebophrya sp. A25]|eukprot:GSA25T00024996001.1